MELCNKYLVQDNTIPVYVSLACAIGLNRAIVLNKIHYWITKENNTKVFDGRKWTYNSVKAWNLQFPFWEEKTIRNLFRDLERSGLLIVGNFNKAGFDRTKWHTICYEKLEAVLLAYDQKGEPLGKVYRGKRKSLPHDVEHLPDTIPLSSSLSSSMNSSQSLAVATPQPEVKEFCDWLALTYKGRLITKDTQRQMFGAQAKEAIAAILKADGLEGAKAVWKYAMEHDKFWQDKIIFPRHYDSIREKARAFYERINSIQNTPAPF